MNTGRCIVFLILYGLCAGLAAEPLEIDRPAEILSESDPSIGAPVYDRRGKKPLGNVLRCWQHGRLLYEGDGATRVANASSSAIVINRQSGEALTVLNLNDGLCILTGH
jgi:hypothetical protein